MAILSKIDKYLPPICVPQLRKLRNNIAFSAYKKVIKQNVNLKDKHSGQRCFILGSGPSIKEEDLKPLAKEHVFFLNNFYVHEDFKVISQASKAQYYLTAPIHKPQSTAEWTQWLKGISQEVPNNINMLLGLNALKENTLHINHKEHFFKDNSVHYYYAGIRTDEVFSYKESQLDLTKIIWTANNASIYAIMSAMYMGFDEIYLLGMDHNYFTFDLEEDYRFYKDAKHQNNEQKRNVEALNNASVNTQILESTAKTFKQYALLKERHKGKIINLSPHSILDIFPKKTLTEIL